MDDPFKLKVLRALTEALKTITPANGYQHDLADSIDEEGLPVTRVFRGRPWFGDSDPIPMVSVLEAGDPFDAVVEFADTSAQSSDDWNLNIQGFVIDDKDNPTDPAYRLLADIRKCLAVEKTRMSPNGRQPNPLGLGAKGGPAANSVTKLLFGSGTVRAADDISAKAWLWLPVTVRIVENAMDPYTP